MKKLVKEYLMNMDTDNTIMIDADWTSAGFFRYDKVEDVPLKWDNKVVTKKIVNDGGIVILYVEK